MKVKELIEKNIARGDFPCCTLIYKNTEEGLMKVYDRIDTDDTINLFLSKQVEGWTGVFFPFLFYIINYFKRLKMTIREFNEQFEELSRQFGLHDVLNTFNLHLTQRIHDLQEKDTDTEEEYNDDLREIDNLEYLQEQIVLILNELTKLGYVK